MAKNDTHKIVKSLIYLAREKKYKVAIYDTKFNRVTDREDIDFVWNNYKKYSSGYIVITKVNDSVYKDQVASFKYSFNKNEFDVHYNAINMNDFRKDLLTEANFLMNLYF